MLSWLVFAVSGRVLIFLWQKFRLPFKNEWLEELHKCDLCSGFWIYSILAVAFGVNVFSDMFVNSGIVGEICTGAITSFIIHIFIIGWKTKFEVVVI